MTEATIRRIAAEARAAFEEGRVDRRLLKRLYRQYQAVPKLRRFLDKASGLFPNLNCGLASLYLRHRLGEGRVVQGMYGTQNHTFLLVGDLAADITADQYGGPKVYVGRLRSPWTLKPVQP